MRLLTINEAADKLGKSIDEINASLEKFWLPKYKTGREFMVAQEHLDILEDRQPDRKEREVQLEFWDEFRTFLSAQCSFLTPMGQDNPRYLVFRRWHNQFSLAASVFISDRQLWVDLTISGANAKEHFLKLEMDRLSIEGEIGKELNWAERALAGKESWILARKRANTTDRKAWPNQHKFLAETLEAFEKSFDQRIQVLKTI